MPGNKAPGDCTARHQTIAVEPDKTIRQKVKELKVHTRAPKSGLGLGTVELVGLVNIAFSSGIARANGPFKSG